MSRSGHRRACPGEPLELAAGGLAAQARWRSRRDLWVTSMSALPSTRGALGRLLAPCAIVTACSAGGTYAVAAGELHATAKVLDAQPRVDLGAETTTTTGSTSSGGA